MTQHICQWVVLLLQVYSFLYCVNTCFNGRPEREPEGFSGFVVSVVVIATVVTIYYFAGAFNTIIK